jgi:serine/threonine protein kinase
LCPTTFDGDERRGDRLEASPAHSQAAPSSEPVAEQTPRDGGDGLLPVGTSIKHYEIIRSLGQGGMGTVYLARDTKLGRLVAIKLLLQYTGHSSTGRTGAR